MEKAAFKLDNYHFTSASLDFNIANDAKLNISFIPKGAFHSKDSQYELTFEVIIESNVTRTTVVKVSCVALFSFSDKLKIDEIPEYFFPNSLAIVFPYVQQRRNVVSLVEVRLFPTVTQRYSVWSLDFAWYKCYN